MLPAAEAARWPQGSSDFRCLWFWMSNLRALQRGRFPEGACHTVWPLGVIQGVSGWAPTIARPLDNLGQLSWVLFPALLASHHVILGELLSLAVPPFPHWLGCRVAQVLWDLEGTREL